jgi:hypothetical protein
MCDFDNNRWPRANIHFKQGGIYQRITVESHLLLVSPRSILVSSYVDFYKKGKKKKTDEKYFGGLLLTRVKALFYKSVGTWQQTAPTNTQYVPCKESLKTTQ